IRSAPVSPKLRAETPKSGAISTRSSAEDRPSRNLLPPPLPLPQLKSYESLPAINRPVIRTQDSSNTIPGLLASPQRSPNRGRSSTVSSVSSIDVAPRMSRSRSRSRRASTIFGNLVGRDSGRGTPVDKLSMEQEEEDV